jgi:PBSX family phage terminase large subunit
VYGGSSAAKTYSIMQALSLCSYSNGYNVFTMRKHSNNIKDTIYADFKQFNKHLQPIFQDITIIQNEIRSDQSKIRFKGVDDSEKLKGISGFTKVFPDEITEFNYEDLKQIRKRLRGLPNQQIIMTWNPVSKYHWIKTEVIDKNTWTEIDKDIEGIPFSKLSDDSFIKVNETGNSILIKTTYKDNFWIVGHPKFKNVGFYDKHVIEDFEFDKVNDPNNYNIYALGNWGDPSSGLIFKEVNKFSDNFKMRDRIYWTTYNKLPEQLMDTVYGLDFGGGGELTDEVDGSSKNVYVKLRIDYITMSVYVKLLLYKGFIGTDDLYLVVKDSGECYNVADNARTDKILELRLKGIPFVIGAKTTEGGSFQVVDGYDIMRQWKFFIHEEDEQIKNEWRAHKWEVNKRTGIPTGQPEDKFKDVADSVRYAIVFYHLRHLHEIKENIKTGTRELLTNTE